jgi:hypothetical protein
MVRVLLEVEVLAATSRSRGGSDLVLVVWCRSEDYRSDSAHIGEVL